MLCMPMLAAVAALLYRDSKHHDARFHRSNQHIEAPVMAKPRLINTTDISPATRHGKLWKALLEKISW